ncbi:transposase [Acinetobacter sichuanensis]|uniref:transposase n=1 Tax=Acinetobacter sichuanensis TaxID=2136183 RepID=UPI0028103AB1|nr:transposase [Acinetobacter sichuanensis]MDQ9022743.1 transposase [Acinetobacter sichuanensis]
MVNRGKSSAGWLYGFKLYFIIHSLYGFLNLKVTLGNVYDVVVLEALTLEFKVVLLLGNKYYLSKAKAEILVARG